MIEGPHETLKKINDAILHHEVQENSSPDWEGNVLLALGTTWKQNTPDGKGYYMRGFIQDSPSLGEDTLEFYAEEAWGVTDFNLVLEENFPDIKVYFIAEEPGMEVYITNDAEGKFFLTRYYVDTCIKDDYQSEYFETKEKPTSGSQTSPKAKSPMKNRWMPSIQILKTLMTSSMSMNLR